MSITIQIQAALLYAQEHAASADVEAHLKAALAAQAVVDAEKTADALREELVNAEAMAGRLADPLDRESYMERARTAHGEGLAALATARTEAKAALKAATGGRK